MVDTPRNRTSSSQHGDVADDLKGDARDLKETATRQGEAKAAEEKDRVGRAAHSASSAMQTAADELQGDDRAPDWLASAFSSVAREVEGLASRLENKSPRELANETRRFARDNPSAFLAASAAAGFAAARFLRAGAEYHDDYDVGQNDSDRGNAYHTRGTYGASTGMAETTPATTAASTTPTATTGLGDREKTVAQARTSVASSRSTGETR